MIETNRMKGRPRRALRPAVTLAAGALLLCALPAGAGLSGAVGTAGAGHSLKETLAETTDLFGEMVGAFIDGDDETVSELMGEVAKTPGKLIKRAFPVLEAPQAIAGRLTSAKQKIERFAGGVKEGFADARAALAVGGDDKSGSWSDAALLEGDPLPAPVGTAFAAPTYDSPTEALAALKGEAGAKPADSSWDFEAWVIAKQEANPHCYGVVDLESLPPECFREAGAESPAADKVADSPRAGAADWASGDWAAEGDGWAGWDNSDSRYSEEDREAARVGVFAVRCWGVYEVSKHHGLYELMRDRMQRNDCPNEETDQASSGASEDADYLTALSDLEAQEAEQLRLEEEERQRQVQMEAEEERERLARREEQRRQDERERQRQQAYDREEQRQQAEYRQQALQNMAESLRGAAEQVNRTYGGGGTSGGGEARCEGQSRYSSVGCKQCWNGAVIVQTKPCPPKPCNNPSGVCGQR